MEKVSQQEWCKGTFVTKALDNQRSEILVTGVYTLVYSHTIWPHMYSLNIYTKRVSKNLNNWKFDEWRQMNLNSILHLPPHTESVYIQENYTCISM